MTPYTQSKVSSLDGTVSGSCFRTCIGSILDIDPETIPHFEDMKAGKWCVPYMQYLYDNGFSHEGMCGKKQTEPFEDFWERLTSLSPGVDGYYIVNGPSPRAHVTRGHSVVYKDGVMVWDPHPSGAGLLSIEDAYMIERLPS